MNTSVGYIGCYGAGEECDINRSNVLDLLHVKIAITLPYLPLLVLAVGGNLLVCKTILSRMRPSVTHFFLLNLSLTDILSTFAVIPMTALADLWFVDWPFGDFMCRLVPFIQCLTIQSTSLTYVIISCDRFALVFRPLRWRRKLSLSRGRLVIMLVWLLAAFQGIPLFLVNELVISEIGEANELEDKNNRAEKNPIGIGNYTSLKLNGSVEALCFSNLASKDLVYSNPNSASVGSRSAEASSQASGTRVHCQETWTPRAGTAYGVTLMTLQYVLPLCLIISSYAAIVWRLWGQSAPGECDVVRDKRIARSRRKVCKGQPAS
ncbi:unnamed protein product [Protopolystoma xenopodis]|uniref:G-protein coupled receptors family 1 profile domain-containing protein n=1 Tax=Protopolystoma xenopodis TaxID=117903 RepID=A0A448WIC4_9PLAT|nr:unnamed protein product [Protopolystoma xenopodis]